MTGVEACVDLSSEFRFRFSSGYIVPVHGSLAGLVATTGDPINIVDIKQDHRFVLLPLSRHYSLRFEYCFCSRSASAVDLQTLTAPSGSRWRSALCFPIKNDEIVIGVLQAINKSERMRITFTHVSNCGLPLLYSFCTGPSFSREDEDLIAVYCSEVSSLLRSRPETFLGHHTNDDIFHSIMEQYLMKPSQDSMSPSLVRRGKTARGWSTDLCIL